MTRKHLRSANEVRTYLRAQCAQDGAQATNRVDEYVDESVHQEGTGVWSSMFENDAAKILEDFRLYVKSIGEQ